MAENMQSHIRQLYIDNSIEKTARAKSGSYYTPFPIALKMAEKALFLYLDSHKTESESHLPHLLANIKFADISCGSGIFVIAWLSAIENMLSKCSYLNSVEKKDILLKAAENVVMADIDNEALLHFKSFIKKYHPDFEGRTIQKHINPLLDSSLADLREECGGFDVILGNPPYIGERGNLEVFDELRTESIYKNYYQGKMDYLYFFFFRAYELLNPRGIVGFLTTQYFVTADGASILRSFLQSRVTVKEIVNYRDRSLFKSAPGHHSMELYFENSLPHADKKVKVTYGDENSNFYYKDLSKLFDQTGQIVLSDKANDSLIDKIQRKCKFRLGDLFQVKQGLVSGMDYDNSTKKGVFSLTWDEAVALDLEKEYLKPFYKNSHIKHNTISTSGHKYIIYTNNRFTNEDDFIKKAPNIYSHLLGWKGPLSRRRETQKGIRPWYELHWPRDEEIFKNPAIVCPHRAAKNYFALSQGDFYASADVYYIFPKDSTDWDLEYINALCQILNSKLYFYLLKMTGKSKGKILELYATPLKELKIPCIKEFLSFIKDYDSKTLHDEYEKLVYDYFNLSRDEILLCEGEIN